MYCIKCGELISLLGLLDQETKYKQFICLDCGTIYLKNPNGLIFPKEEMKNFEREEDGIQ